MTTFRPGRLLKLAKFLDTLPPEKFYFPSLVQKFNKAKGCGTVCCAIGWCPVVFPGQSKWERVGDDVEIKFPVDSEIEGAAEFFGIELNEACRLFLPNMSTSWGTLVGDDAVPQEVARNIRKFVAHKKVESQ